MRRKKHNYIYPHFKFDRNAANAWNDMAYETWLIMDEGMDKPYPQRFHNFIFKYGTIRNKKLGHSILHYMNKDDFEKYVKPWVLATKSERKKVRRLNYPFNLLEHIVKNVIRLGILNYKIAENEIE